jgi:outer membrane scaffolding protein for murein synthesis (MipA/OmpV family)
MSDLTKLFCAALLLWSAAAAAQDDLKLVGAGVRTRPKVDGFAERTTELVPVLRYFGKPWFVRTTQGILEGGARWTVRPGFDVGAQLAYEPGPNDEDPGASIGAHAEWERKLGPVPVLGLIRLRQNLDTDRGLQMDFRTAGGVYQGHGFLAIVFGQFTLATEKYYRAYYGVDESGLLYVSVGAQASYDLSRHWMLVGSAERKHMSDNAARSPLVVQRSASYLGIGLAYSF